VDSDGKLIVALADIPDAKDKVKLIVASPYMPEALKSMLALIGEDDLPDNAELSGAAICDMARSAVLLASK